jgi:hypothetical protein
MAIPRRSLNEVIARYKLEPGLDDIYVEGLFDKKIIDRAFREAAVHRPVYEIDSVDISDEILQKFEMSRGNKQEVIALCRELDLTKDYSVTFFVDKDKDEHLGKIIDHPRLFYTIYSDLENSFFKEEIVKEIICDAGSANCGNWEKLYKSIVAVLKTYYAIQLSLDGFNGKIPSIHKNLRKNGDEVDFDFRGYIKRLNLHPNAQSALIKEALDWLNIINDHDVRNCNKGHDYLNLIEWLIKKYNGNKNIAEGLDGILVLLVPRIVADILKPFGIAANDST